MIQKVAAEVPSAVANQAPVAANASPQRQDGRLGFENANALSIFFNLTGDELVAAVQARLVQRWIDGTLGKTFDVTLRESNYTWACMVNMHPGRHFMHY